MARMAHGQQVVNRVERAPGWIAQVVYFCHLIDAAPLAGSAAALYGLCSDGLVSRVLQVFGVGGIRH
jgi:hypothetical protein